MGIDDTHLQPGESAPPGDGHLGPLLHSLFTAEMLGLHAASQFGIRGMNSHRCPSMKPAAEVDTEPNPVCVKERAGMEGRHTLATA